MTDREPIGNKIKRARERKRMTQEALGDAIGVTQKTIDNWENDRTYPRSAIGALEAKLGPLTDEVADQESATPGRSYPDFIEGDEGFRRIWDIPEEVMPADEREYAILRVKLRRVERLQYEAERQATETHKGSGAQPGA